MFGRRAWVLIALLTALLFSAASGDVPLLISYQGQLNNSAGDPVADGNYEIRLRILRRRL